MGESPRPETASRSRLKQLVENLVQSYEDHAEIIKVDSQGLLNRNEVIEILAKLQSLIFPGYFGSRIISALSIEYYAGEILEGLSAPLEKLVCTAFSADCTEGRLSPEETVFRFLSALPEVRELLASDVSASFDGDPAAFSRDEIISSYPGIYAIMVYRLAQGIDRVWLFESKYDLYFPEFQGLSEQAVLIEELYNYGPPPSDRVIGYQGRYDEYRFKRNRIAGLMRNDFDYWTLFRKFVSPPALNADLIRPNAQERFAFKRFLAVPSEPAFIVSIGNRLHVTRPMPWRAEPGFFGN